MALTTIGATHNASGRPVTFDQISSAYTQVVKAAFGEEGNQTLVSATDPLPVTPGAKMSDSVPALGVDGESTDQLFDRAGRAITVEDAPDEEKGAVNFFSAASSYTILGATADYTAKIKALTIRNWNTRKSVVITVLGGAATLMTIPLAPGDVFCLPEGIHLQHSVVNEAVTLSSSDATVKLSIVGSYVKARV